MPTYADLIAAGELLDDDEAPREAREAPKVPAKLAQIAKSAPQRVKGTEANREKHVRAMMRRFGYDASKYDSMLRAQGGVCAICKQPPSSGHLVIDHCHGGPGIERRYASLRDLLCDPCNRALGALKDDADRCEAAAAYLRRHRARLDKLNDQ